jgi:hypothetical protein
LEARRTKRSGHIGRDVLEPMIYNYATDVAAGACPGCGEPVILYHHVRLTAGEERCNVTSLETIFCRECAERMGAPNVGQTFLSTEDRQVRHGESSGGMKCLPHGHGR